MAAYTNQQLYYALSELQLINQRELDAAWRASNNTNIPLASILLRQDLVKDEHLGEIIADLIKLPFIVLSRITIPHDVLTTIPEIVAKKQHIIAFKKDRDGLHVAMSDPSNIQLRDFLAKKTGLPIIIHFATTLDIENKAQEYTPDVKEAFETIMHKNVTEAKGAAHTEVPIITIADTIILYAYQNRASDIHIESFTDHTLVRFRIDGMLHDVVELPKNLHLHLINRIRVMASLRTDEHQKTQDGKIRWRPANAAADAEAFDIRVSIVPAIKGEKVVMRLLSERSRQFSLADLGFSAKDFEKVQSSYQKPFGMLLTVGPTGSGKTTTIYTIIKLLNKRDVNIMTIEDPVEYDIEGVNALQVNPKTGFTFATGLRSIVRQDPDVIFVGEIRDEETAGIAVNAAMTGHVVLTTLHANNAATTFPRLTDMKIEPYLIASTTTAVIAQRLVRNICQQCRVSKEHSLAEFTGDIPLATLTKYFPPDSQVRLYNGKGCEICHQTGYAGRIGLFEILVMTEAVRQAIVARKDASTIHQIAVREGMTTMLEDGLDKVRQGMTTIEEVTRVMKE